MCDDAKYSPREATQTPQGIADQMLKQAQYESGQLRAAHPHEMLDSRIRKSAVEFAQATRAKAFLEKHPEFIEFLQLKSEGAF